MRLLFLAHRIPYPPIKGDKIRSFHQLKGLAARGHEVHLAAFVHEPGDPDQSAPLASLCASSSIVPLDRRSAKLLGLSNLMLGGPFSLGYFASRPMRRQVDRKLAESSFDALVVCSSAMTQYVPRALAARTLVDLVDADSEKWGDYAQRARPPLSWLYRLERRRLRRFERAILTRFARTVVTTEREAALLVPFDEPTQRERLHVITNGVDLEYFRPGPGPELAPDRLSADERRLLTEPSVPRLVFTGAMDYPPNVDAVRYFIREVFPLVREREPRAQLLIVGSSPTRAVQQLGERPGVVVTGFVEDVRPYLAAAMACVVPLRIARGVQNKVLEAMASGRAVVATPQAVAGLRVVDGDHVLIGRTPRELARALLAVIQDQQLRRRLGSRARHYVEREHAWGPPLARFSALVESLATTSRPVR